MSEEEKPVVYRNGFLPKSQSKMYQAGKNTYGQPSAPQTDYSNSHRSHQRPPEYGPSKAGPPGTDLIESKPDGFFKATLKQAASSVYHEVIDPSVRNFLDNTLTSMLKTMIWGENARKYLTFTPGQTPYRDISTGKVVQPQPVAETQQYRLSPVDKSWQRFYRCHTPTREQARAIMSRMYKTLRSEGQVTLAQYYQAFGYPYDFTDEEWGWTSLPEGRMYADECSDGYHVMMPHLEKLDSEIRR